QLADGTYPGGDHIGPMTQSLAASAESATIFGAPLSGTFMQAGDNWHIRVVTIGLIVAMSATTFLTQRQLTMKNMPPAALQGPMAQQQKVLLYVLPLIFAFSGVNFPIGVLIYWTTTNLWSMGQQFYTIRRMPAPGSEAEKALLERKARKAAAHGVIAETDDAAPRAVIVEDAPRPTGQRQQPKRKDRNKARPAGSPGTSDAPSGTASSGSTGPAAGSSSTRSSGPDDDGPGKSKPSSKTPTKPKK
ncbi:MAG: YidC/Oxa1 family membrane protein insertase, partial [Aquihabitans sp.]